LTDDSLQSAVKDQQESRALTEKQRDAVVKLDNRYGIEIYSGVARFSLR